MRKFWRTVALCLMAWLLVGLHPVGASAAFEDALDGFTTDQFSDTEKSIAALMSSGDPKALDVLEALADRRLLFVAATKGLFIQARNGAVTDVRTGQTVAQPPDSSPVRLNNRLRNVVQNGIGSLTLLSSDPVRRRQAAESVLRSRDAASLPLVESALAMENTPQVRAILEMARAAIVIDRPQSSDADRIRAATMLGESGSKESLSVLRQALPRATEPQRDVIERGIASIEQKERLRATAQTVWFGISLGSVLLLAAIGLAISFGVMGVINMAHGEMVMIGAYVTFVVQEIFRARFPALLDWSLPVALPIAFLVAGGIGVLVERTVIRFLYGRPLETLLATYGVSLIIQQAVRTWFGPTNREVSAPSYMAGSFDVWGVPITYGRLWIVVFTLVVFAALLLVMKSTYSGLFMRAVTQNRRMASAMGIRTRLVDMMTFGLGSGIAGIAGVALSQIDNVSPNLGQSYIIDSFMVVVFGGVGNLWGTLVGAFSIGIANKILEPYAGAVLGKIFVLI
ncbi:MAG: urea ABC transporter permease subunit UrtB, partial [Beijerinckiaceae bacterium]